jgi:uncharacterized protein (DUF433 family)
MTTLSNVAHRDPEILSGTVVFMGTRVPVRSLFEYLEWGILWKNFYISSPLLHAIKPLLFLT